MKEDNTPTVTKQSRTPSRKLRLRLDSAKTVMKLNQKAKTVRQRKKETKANAKQGDAENHVSLSRVPRLKKNSLTEAPRATTKYKKRQVSKTWLPTHLWHTKRAYMTRPTEPLWRMAIPLSPTEKSYRPSHRAAGNQGCIAWDTSYMSTVACKGTGIALEGMLKALGFVPQGLSQALQKKWRTGTRSAQGWVHELDNEKRIIAPAMVTWCRREQSSLPASKRPNADDQMEIDHPEHAKPQTLAKPKPKLDHQILVRIHPSAFHQFWQELLRAAKMQKPQVVTEDLRFEIGSIEVQGPGSTEALLGVLRPFATDAEVEDSDASLWTSLAGLNNPSILPQNAILAFDVNDPRLNHPPKQIKIPKTSDSSRLNEILVSWPSDKNLVSSRLLSHKVRWEICNSLPSQKAINRRRSLAPPGQAPAVTNNDPRIPVILLASRGEDGSAPKSGNLQGIWTVLLPWSCVDAVWRSLMYYPHSSGGTPRFGGLRQKQQIAFEQRVPWFPGDLPGTEAGKAWERTQSERRFDEWIRRPAKHRIAWDTVDLGLGRLGELGNGWTCDWEFLFETTEEMSEAKSASNPQAAKDDPMNENARPMLTQRQRKSAKAQTGADAKKEETARRRNTSSPESEEEAANALTVEAQIKYMQLSPIMALALLKAPSTLVLPQQPALMMIRITLLDKGTPSPAARIYRLPSYPKQNPQFASPISEDDPQGTQPRISPSTPPAGQNPPATSSTDSSATSTSLIRDLRSRWLAMDTPSEHAHLPKLKTNRFNVSRHQFAYPREALAKINVLPKNAPQEIVEKFGPTSAFGKGDGEIPKVVPRAQQKKKDKGKDQSKPKTTKISENGNTYLDPGEGAPHHHLNTLAQLTDLLVSPFASPTTWDKHPPCPDARDLIGFVTSGGHNLAEGRGTAIGSVWAQKLLEGWGQDDHASGSGKMWSGQKERERRLCIVRNAGESIGRLGIWEAC